MVRDPVKAAGAEVVLYEYISLNQHRHKHTNRCARICELGTGSRASQHSQIRRHKIQYASIFHGKTPVSQVLSSSLSLSVSFFSLIFVLQLPTSI